MLDDIATLAQSAAANLNGPDFQLRHRRVIGIAGPPGAGKSTLMQALVKASETFLGPLLVVGLPMDGFHLPNVRLRKLNLLEHKGAVDTFDANAFISALQALTTSAVISTWPAYSRLRHEPIPNAIVVPSTTRLIFVEGNYLLLRRPPWINVQKLLSASWYLTADTTVIQARLHRRHSLEGVSIDDVQRRVAQDLENLAIVERTKRYADRVIRVSDGDPQLRGLTDPATGRPIVLDKKI